MKRDHLERALDHLRVDLDPELFAAPLTVQHANRLMMDGGNNRECPYNPSNLHPRHMERFLDPAVKVAQAIKHFEHEWRNLHRILSGSTAVSRHVTPTSYSLMVTSALTNVNFRLTNIVV
jgi:hypothetical protein